MEDPQRREIALFRYGLIREAADAELTPAERGRLVRQLAGREHRGPNGQWKTVGRSTLDRPLIDLRTELIDDRHPLDPAIRRQPGVTTLHIPLDGVAIATGQYRGCAIRAHEVVGLQDFHDF